MSAVRRGVNDQTSVEETSLGARMSVEGGELSGRLCVRDARRGVADRAELASAVPECLITLIIVRRE